MKPFFTLKSSLEICVSGSDVYRKQVTVLLFVMGSCGDDIVTAKSPAYMFSVSGVLRTFPTPDSSRTAFSITLQCTMEVAPGRFATTLNWNRRVLRRCRSSTMQPSHAIFITCKSLTSREKDASTTRFSPTTSRPEVMSYSSTKGRVRS